MAEEEVVTIPATPVDLKRKLDEVEPEQHAGLINGSNGDISDESKPASDSSQAKRAKLQDDETPDGLDNGKTQENGSSVEVKEEEELQEPKEEETEGPSVHKDENQESLPPVEEVQDPINAEESEKNKTCGVDQPAVETTIEECNGSESQKEVDESSKELNEKVIGEEENKELGGDNSQKEVDVTQSTTRRIDVPSSKVGILIGKGGETIRHLQFNSGAKIQILRDSEADPNSALRPVEIIGTVVCIENAEKLISAVIAEAEAGGSPALVARRHPATHAIGIPEQIEIKVPNDKVGLIIGRGGETIKNMQTRSGARIQLIPQHAEGDGEKERTVRISGDKRQIDIATDMIKEVMYQDARPSPYAGGCNQPPYRPRGPGGPPQWGSRGPYAPHSMPYDYHNRGPYSSQGSHYNSPGYGGYPPQHMPPRGGYNAGWDQRPPPSGPYDYYGRQGAQTSGPVPPPDHAPSPALGAATPSGDVPYQGATPAAAAPLYGSTTTNMAPQQQYGYTSSGGPVQQQAYPSYSSAPSDGYNNGTQTPATGPAYQQQSVQPTSSTHDQPGAQQAGAAGYGGQVAPTSGYSSYPSSQPAYGTAQAQNSGNYGYNTSSQDPNYGYGAAPGSQTAYSQAATTQAGYEQQPATQPAGYVTAPGSTQVNQYDASQVYAAPR
ncbi:PREDICTED: far upstream element-binding protein 2 [Camelina sativa]|uniref:Far upstream element-binding protein 2 n=1 Tax=Camelina sativa TaxID=90675 RepID=A0ABM0TD12_CAMSA|nr:PREDICTED: far upstream element-binding protein 2 [Camelina sativa]